MCAGNIDPDIQEKITLMIRLLNEKDQRIKELENRTVTTISDENHILTYIRIFQEFVNESHTHNWRIERKYNTQISQNYIDVDFSKYRDFLDSRISKDKHNEFKQFLIDLRLVEPDTFMKSKGIIVGAKKEQKKVMRIRQEVYKRMTDNLAG